MEWYNNLLERYDFLLTWAGRISQTDEFWIAMISAIVSAVVAAFVGIAFSKIEKDEFTISKFSIGKCECDEGDIRQIYKESVCFINKDDRTVRNIYLKYTFNNRRKKKRFKIIKPDRHYIIEEYAEHKDISNEIFYKNYIPYALSLLIFDIPNFIYRKIENIFRKTIWSKLKPFIINARILMLFLNINNIHKKSKKFDEEIILFLFVHKTQYDTRLAEYLNFKVYRKWSDRRSELLLNKFFNKEDKIIGSTNEYRAYSSFIMEFFIYYFAVYKNTKVKFSNEITHIPGVIHIGNQQIFERFTIDCKKCDQSSRIKLIKLFIAYKLGKILLDYPHFDKLSLLWKKDKYEASESLGNIYNYEPRVSRNIKFGKQVGIELYSDVKISYPLPYSIEIRGLQNIKWKNFSGQRNIWYYGDKTIINRIVLSKLLIPESSINKLPSIISDTNVMQQIFIINVCSGEFIYYGHETFAQLKYFRYGQIKSEILGEIVDGLEILSDYKKFKNKYIL